ncbi:MAG TPA: hypothetical protein V6C58_24650 [Allocoleopsis sp.]
MSLDKEKQIKRQELVNNWPNIKSINPYLDQRTVRDIYDAMLEQGLYKKPYYKSSYDLPIIKMILISQGKSVSTRSSSRG